MSRISYPSFILAVLSVVSPVIIPYMVGGFGGEMSIIFGFFALVTSMRDPSSKNIFNVVMWLIFGLVSYFVAMWNAFNVWIGSFLGVVSCFFFFGHAIIMAFTKTDKIAVKIAAVAVLLLIIIHIIFTYFKILESTVLLNGLKNSLPGIS